MRLVHPVGSPDEDLLDVRLSAAGQAANRVGVYRRVAPTQNRKAFLNHDFFHQSFATHALVRFHRKKHHAHAVFAGRGQREAKPRALGFEKGVRNLDEHTRAVTRLRIATAGAAVGEIDENLDALENDVVALLPRNVRHKTNPAGIVLVARIVKTLGLWQSPGGNTAAHLKLSLLFSVT